MFRTPCVVVLLIAPSLTFAQKDPAPKDGKVTIPMTLHPTAAPVPLSKLRLYPHYEDLQPGNRVQGILKCFMEQDAFFKRDPRGFAGHARRSSARVPRNGSRSARQSGPRRLSARLGRWDEPGSGSRPWFRPR
jgi:hypothetical protein